MKSEPDRMDLLIVVLPLVLLGVLSFQVYRFVEMRHERTPGSQIAAEVSALIARGPAQGAAAPSGPRSAAEPVADGSEKMEAATADAAEESAPEGTAQPQEAGAGATQASDAEPVAAGEAPGAGSPPAEGLATGATPQEVAGAPAEAGGSSPIAAADAGSLPPAEPTPDPFEASQPEAGGPAQPAGGSSPTGGAGVPVLLAAGPDGDPRAEPLPEDPAPQPGDGGGPAIPANPSPDVNPEKPAVVSAVPSSNTVKVGDVVPIEIRIQNGIDVGSVPFHLKFDPAVLLPNESPSSLRGPFLSVPGHDTQFLATPGPGGDTIVVGLSVMGAQQGAQGSGVLATIYLKAHAPGTSMVQLIRASVRGADARKLPALFEPTVIKVEP